MCPTGRKYDQGELVDQTWGGRGRRAAFTITELMVAVSLMSVVIYALYAVFNQTQRALRANESQIDTTERGRGILELIARDVELARVGNLLPVTNFYARIVPSAQMIQGDIQPGTSVTARTNVHHVLYYLTQKDRGWRGIGYALYQRNPTNESEMGPAPSGLGSLYRYETSTNYGVPTTNLFAEFAPLMPNPLAPTNLMVTNFNHVADGVVHFRISAFDTEGHLMAFNTTNRDPAYLIFRCGESGTRIGATSSPGSTANNATAVLQANSDFNAMETRMTFRSNAAPAYIELELGILDPESVKTYNLFMKDAKEIGQRPDRARTFLEKRIGKVQIFRKRIPLRTVSP